MSQAFKKYQTLKRKVHGWKAKDAQKDKELQLDKFPHCRGTFDDCPTEEELKAALEKKMAPVVCGKCPIYEDSGKPLPVIRNKISSEKEE